MALSVAKSKNLLQDFIVYFICLAVSSFGVCGILVSSLAMWDSTLYLVSKKSIKAAKSLSSSCLCEINTVILLFFEYSIRRLSASYIECDKTPLYLEK